MSDKMSSRERVQERDRGGGEAGYRSGYGGGGGGVGGGARGGNFRGRGGATGYKPRRYWDNDEYYKDDRERGGRRRRRSRSRSRSRSYSSRSRSRSPGPRRGRSRSPRPPEEYIPRTTEMEHCIPPHAINQTPEPYIPTSDPANSWTGSRMSLALPQPNGQSMNPYADTITPYHPPQYQESQGPLSSNNQAAMAYGYSHSIAPVTQYPRPQAPIPGEVIYSQPPAIGLTASIPPPPVISEPKAAHETSEGSKKNKKEKRKKKKRHHSSSSSSSSSDESSGSRRRSKSKKDQRNSDSSSEEDKKESGPPKSVLTIQQKEALAKQREGYKAKLEILEREIGKLRNKEDELIRSHADRRLIDENLKLQAELKGRCKAVLIVLEKIADVFKDGSKSSPAVEEKPQLIVPAPPPPVVPSSIPILPVQKNIQPNFESRGLSSDGNKSGLSAFDYFDNRQHWCRLCNVFPGTVEEMLSHFHSKEHHDQIQQLGIDEKPWHKRNSASDSKHLSGARKAPFRGMQFFSPVEGWYCRLCNGWMGDPHCAVEHLKCDEHNSNYMNFLEEHPDWEKKWVSDREKALDASGTQDPSHSIKKSRFDDNRPSDRSVRPLNVQEDMESGKSIRVQMRNSLKSEEKGQESQYAPSIGEAKPNKDSGLEEWMSKPKVPVDIIDTQKFAAILRQKHGVKEKEATRDTKSDVLEVKLIPAAPLISPKDGRDSRKDDKRRPDKVELQISNRDKDRDIRDRYRDRDNRGSRRRSRSRSRSRSRERRYNRRRSRSRSRSRERPDRGRDRRDNRSERERPEIKEVVKKLPMIGKMPLYKRPVFTKDKVEPEEIKDLTADIPTTPVEPLRFLQSDSSFTRHKKEESRVSTFSDNSLSNPPFSFDTQHVYSQNSSVGEYGSVTAPASYGSHHSGVAPAKEESPSFDIQQHIEGNDNLPGGDEKEKSEAPAALPDDFQQALDIIYAVNSGGNVQPKSTASVPQPVPPPGESASSTNADKVTSPEVGEYGSADYAAMGSNGYGNYMDYQPYQQSFDGYAPYEELDDGPPGVGDGPPGTAPIKPPTRVENARPDKVEEKDPPPPGDDDMDDLRMLGIDVDDTAVVKH